MGQDRFDVSEIGSQGDGTCTLAGALFSELDETFAVKVREPQSPESSLKEAKARGL